MNNNIDPFNPSTPQVRNVPTSQDPFAQDDDPKRRWIILAVSGAAAIGCCIIFLVAFFYLQPNQLAQIASYFPSVTPTPTHTPTSTPTKTPTPTQTATPTFNLTATAAVAQSTGTAVVVQTVVANATSKWKVAVKEPFDNNKRQWLAKTADDDYARKSYTVEDGVYRWDINSHKGFIGWVRASTKSYSNFWMSAEIQQIEGPDLADYGLVFREDPKQNFYYFGINEQGEFVILLYYNEWITLQDWTKTDLIQPDKPNRLTVIAQGSDFLFFINDQFITELTDDKVASGTLALAAELADADQHAILQFDNVEIRVP